MRENCSDVELLKKPTWLKLSKGMHATYALRPTPYDSIVTHYSKEEV
jgi:hypothetical protein